MNSKGSNHNQTLINGIQIAHTDYEAASQQIADWAQLREHRYVCACNVHSTTTARSNQNLRRALEDSDMNTADGMPLVWGQRLLGQPDAKRVYGPTLMLSVLEKAEQNNLRVAFYGGHPERMPKLLENLKVKFPHLKVVASVIPPFCALTGAEDERFTRQLNKAKPDIILVGIGCPKQEIWMHKHSHQIAGVMIGVGAAFDFQAGAVSQAPAWIQSAGLEWAYRLSREPKRLFRRYLTTNPPFIYHFAKQLLLNRVRKVDYNSTKPLAEGQTGQQLKPGSTVAICIATYHRETLLNSLLESIRHCELPEDLNIELRIVDNDTEESARGIVNQFAAKAEGFSQIHYTVEPVQNIARARNRAIELGQADAYVFVDDDETVTHTWLTGLINGIRNDRTCAVFGSVECKLGKYAEGWQARGRFFEKPAQPNGTYIDWRDTRTSNTIVHGSWFNEKQFRFDHRLGRSGGSDSDLFARMAEAGAEYSSSSTAVVEEFVPAQRATFRWLWNRAYRNGLIYERTVRNLDMPTRPFLRAAKRFLAAIICSIAALPALVLKARPESFYRALLKLPLMFGGLHATVAPNSTTSHVAYHGNKDADKKRVAFLTNIVSPYRKPVFQKLNQSEDFELRIFVDAETEFDRNWDVDCEDLPIEKTDCISWKQTEVSQGALRFEQKLTKHMPYGLFYQLRRFRPDSVISLELGLRSAFAAIYCKLFRADLIIWSYQSRVSAKQSTLRKLWRRTLLSQASNVVGMGKQAREVLTSWGVPAEKIIDAPNAADQANYLLKLSEEKCDRQVEALRNVYAQDKKLAIVVGRLVPLKGIEPMIQAWNALPTSVRDEWKLVFIGEGPLDELIQKQDSAHIEHVGSVPAQSMPYWYAAADLNIFSTCGDVWGLVVNEASLCGTPTLCSQDAGCFDDLIEDCIDGFRLDISSTEAAKTSLLRALEHNDLKLVGERAKNKIRPFTTDQMADRFTDAIRTSKAS